jgi:hypothetical protein
MLQKMLFLHLEQPSVKPKILSDHLIFGYSLLAYASRAKNVGEGNMRGGRKTVFPSALVTGESRCRELG